MDPKFKIPAERVNSAFYFLLTEIYAQNKTIADMLLPLYAKEFDMDIKEAQKHFEKEFRIQKEKSQSNIHQLFGNITLNDILGDEEEKQ